MIPTIASSRLMRIYTLLVARSDGRLGQNLRKADSACGTPGGRAATADETRTPNGGIRTRRTCASIASLISSLSRTLTSPVADGTQLTGMWDYELSFTGETRRGAPGAAVAADPNDAPALFTAIEEQLGLELEADRGPVDVLVIDSVQQPAED